MRSPFPNPLRPTDRARRRVLALALVALVGWLGISAGHLPGEAHAHSHAHSSHEPATGEHGHADRPHLCAACLALERANGGAAPPAVPPPPAAQAADSSPAVAPLPAGARAGAHRSRAPPA
ncbi:MAG: hypothetical protein O9284_11860 [Steroidobacteraceae bacterium]|jgi:hypothetical protein|nr:hypothetical protein [Steroidobacteraceae bacterium]